MQADSGVPEYHADGNPSYRQQWIAEAAYYKAEARGFKLGYETVDWLAAEQDYIAMLIESFLAVSKDEGEMSIAGLRQLAKAVGVSEPENIFSETELICLIQTASQKRPCFRTQIGGVCQDKTSCHWSIECQKLIAEWCR
ncbi:DUF2934 domain-containing protein [Crenothrix polyspora]|uniref:DUF2934 domain-containing protein n=1 Tax=Crenothrix polyspora TaxID=360316 RepID=A0A1R4HIV6_9GAMM|nr:DUF2934 domain-containing protein [Crenothrix polyspora]SJM96157.1 conserved hypothetical protein [Crenothrix polyspora]